MQICETVDAASKTEICSSEMPCRQLRRIIKIKALDEIMELDSDSEDVYKEVLDHMEIHKGNIVDVWLKSIPIGIRLKVKATGKGEYFKTEILETSFIEK